MKTKRFFLESTKLSDSYAAVTVYKDDGNYVELKLADCTRNVVWQFGKPGSTRAKKKIAKIKKLIDEVYNFIHQDER